MNNGLEKRSFETTLPENYREVYHIDAMNKKTGIALNLAALAIMAAIMAIAIITRPEIQEENTLVTIFVYFGAAVMLIAYIVLHELIHGAVYKICTGRRLTFGFSWSCAFCGVPDIYVYRATSILALAAPLAIFTLLFVPLAVLCYFVFPIAYFAVMILLAFHLGGCAGDAYMLILLLVKYRNKSLLVKDTGPAQSLYLPNDCAGDLS